jgi:hypothetical protein
MYIIGSLGYRGERQYGCTQVYRLNIDTLAMERLDTTGTPPGWISRHKATLTGDGQIRISGGKVCAWANGEETYDDNMQGYVLNVDHLTRRAVPPP